MPATQSCTPCCTETQTVNVPGVQGAPGADGSDGKNAYTTLNGTLTVPTTGNNVTATVVNSDWMVVGQIVVVAGPAHFEVVSIPSSTSVVLESKQYLGDVAPATVIASGEGVSPSGVKGSLSAALPTALSDNSTGSASNTIAAGVGVSTLAFHINLNTMTTGAVDLVTDYVPGYRFKILDVAFVTNTVGAGAGASQNINLEINGTNVTGGVVNVTLASTNTLGELTQGTNITANNIGTASDSISVETAAGGTVFSAGDGMLLIRIQNMDTADAVASLADHINDLITALT